MNYEVGQILFVGKHKYMIVTKDESRQKYIIQKIKGEMLVGRVLNMDIVDLQYTFKTLKQMRSDKLNKLQLKQNEKQNK